jgi:hypothetical protein
MFILTILERFKCLISKNCHFWASIWSIPYISTKNKNYAYIYVSLESSNYKLFKNV